jgi:hypothetical protein
MEEIIDLHLDFFKKAETNVAISKFFKEEKITILEGFHENVDLVRAFYQKYYSKPAARIVLCGINPGRKGAGKTGIPFIDFKGASRLMPNVSENDWESSSQFVLAIIEKMGIDNFFKKVYLTNLSWYGFKKERKNVNYYELPVSIQKYFIKNFIKEMDIVKPSLIIPLSKEVEATLKVMKEGGLLPYRIGKRLPHPYWCSIGNRADEYINEYSHSLERLSAIRQLTNS